MSFEVKLDQYSGPLQLLLDLIQSEELPITEVSLSQVTEDYLHYINAHPVPAQELADFLVVASRLLLIKSRAILPQPEEEEEEDVSTLALQLRLYKLFVEASDKLEALYDHSFESFGRSKPTVLPSNAFVVPEDLDAPALKDAFVDLLKKLEPFFRLQQAAIERVISVQERINEIHQAIMSRAKMTFAHMISKSKSKVDVVVSFLALLELVKQQVIHVVQSDSFSEIEITRSE